LCFSEGRREMFCFVVVDASAILHRIESVQKAAVPTDIRRPIHKNTIRSSGTNGSRPSHSGQTEYEVPQFLCVLCVLCGFHFSVSASGGCLCVCLSAIAIELRSGAVVARSGDRPQRAGDRPQRAFARFRIPFLVLF